VYGNIWALSRNTKVYPSPEKFIPERFDEPEGTPDPRDFAFGFGRRLVFSVYPVIGPLTNRAIVPSGCLVYRVCAGQAFAETTVWITMATLLATVDMRPALDENGKEIPLQENFAGTMVA
jgi:cytochrome P450